MAGGTASVGAHSVSPTFHLHPGGNAFPLTQPFPEKITRPSGKHSTDVVQWPYQTPEKE